MKKYIITLLVILLSISILILFSVPDRIQYSLYGMAGYDLDDYKVIKENIEKSEILIDFSTYIKQPIVVYEYDKNVSLILENITYNGNSYTFCFVSYGSSDFFGGDIICFEEDCMDKNITSNYGEFVFQYLGNTSLEQDRMAFYFDLYPKNEVFNTDDFATMNIKIPIEQIVLVSYERV